MKKIICCLLVAVMLSACGGATKSDERKEGEKRIGDIVMVGGKMGIVYAVTSDGQHGMAMSVMEEWYDWEPAKQWCAQYGRGWCLPSKDELLVIYRKKGVLNPILEANGYTELNDWYWSSSTETTWERAWGVNMSDGNAGDFYKGVSLYVRAVSAF